MAVTYSDLVDYVYAGHPIAVVPNEAGEWKACHIFPTRAMAVALASGPAAQMGVTFAVIHLARRMVRQEDAGAGS